MEAHFPHVMKKNVIIVIKFLKISQLKTGDCKGGSLNVPDVHTESAVETPAAQQETCQGVTMKICDLWIKSAFRLE